MTVLLNPSLHPHQEVHPEQLRPKWQTPSAKTPPTLSCGTKSHHMFCGAQSSLCSPVRCLAFSQHSFFSSRSATRQAASHTTFVHQILPSSASCSLPGLPELTSTDHISTSAQLHSNSDLICTCWTSHHSNFHRPHICYCHDCQEHKIIYVKRFRRANPSAVCRSKILGRCLILHRPNAVEFTRAACKQTYLHTWACGEIGACLLNTLVTV